MTAGNEGDDRAEFIRIAITTNRNTVHHLGLLIHGDAEAGYGLHDARRGDGDDPAPPRGNHAGYAAICGWIAPFSSILLPADIPAIILRFATVNGTDLHGLEQGCEILANCGACGDHIAHFALRHCRRYPWGLAGLGSSGMLRRLVFYQLKHMN